MTYEATTHEVTRTFEVEVERDDDVEEGRRYQAYCQRLTGCRVHASSETEVLRKMEQAVDMWLDLADDQLSEDPLSIEERIDGLLSD